MNSKLAEGYAEDVEQIIAQAETLPMLSGMARKAAEVIEEDFRSISGLDILSAAVVLSVIGISDTQACMQAKNDGVSMHDLKATAMMAMTYLYVAHSIFTAEGVLKSLDDHFADGAKEGS